VFAVTYSSTVYVKDETTATAVQAKLTDATGGRVFSRMVLTW
jgi:hypothetical protein